MKTTIFLTLVLAIVTGCTITPKAERVWMEKQTDIFRAAQGIVIAFHEGATSNRCTFPVTNNVELASLRQALPPSYMKRAQHCEYGESEYDSPFIAVIYPESGALTRNDTAYPATCLFISTNGLVSHGRGNLKDMDWHGVVIPKYRDAAVTLCLKHGISPEKLRGFQQAPIDSLNAQ